MSSAPHNLADALKQHYEKVVLAVALLFLAGVCVFMSGRLAWTKQDAGKKVREISQMRTNATAYVRTNMAPAWGDLSRATNPTRLGNNLPQHLFSPEN